MKTLSLKSYPHVTDVQILANVMRGPQHADRGMDLEEMRRSIRVLDALEAVPEGAGEVAIEDADFSCLFEKFQAARFVVASREIIDLSDRLQAVLLGK